MNGDDKAAAAAAVMIYANQHFEPECLPFLVLRWSVEWFSHEMGSLYAQIVSHSCTRRDTCVLPWIITVLSMGIGLTSLTSSLKKDSEYPGLSSKSDVL